MDRRPPGAQWLRCDIHTRTPLVGREALRQARTERLAALAEELIASCRQADEGRGVDLIALTDRNSIEGYRLLRPFLDSITQRGRDAGEAVPTVLPGVELAVGSERPLHFLAVFGAATPAAELGRLILHLFEERDPFDSITGEPLTVGESVGTFLERFHGFCRPPTGERELSFVLMPAHLGEGEAAPELWDEVGRGLRGWVASRHDWHGFLSRRPYTRLSSRFQDILLEWMAARRGEGWEGLAPGRRERYREAQHWPLLECSDPGRGEPLGQRFTWLKMDTPDVEGIRLALLDPASRLRRITEGPPGLAYPWITGVHIGRTDFFEDVRVPLSPCLTALIGGRGSGKSTVVESLRYALDRVRPEDFGGRDEEGVREGVLRFLSPKGERDYGETEGILLPDHEIEVEVVHGGRTYRIRRDSTSLTVAPLPLGTPMAYDVRALLQPRILSQRQISQIARDPASQRRELDALMTPERRRSFEDRRGPLMERLVRAQMAWRSIEERRSSLPARETELRKVEDQIAFLEGGERREAFELFQRYEEARRWLEDIRHGLEGAREGLVAQAGLVREALDRVGPRPEGSPFGGWLEGVEARCGEALGAAAAAVRGQGDMLEEAIRALAGEQAKLWAPGYDQARRAYEAMEAELERRGVPFEHHQRLLEQRAQLIREIREIGAAEEERAGVEGEVEGVREMLARLHRARLGWRQELAQALERSDADVRLVVHGFRDSEGMEREREGWFAGSGMREEDWGVLKGYVFAGGDAFERLGLLAGALRADGEATRAAGGQPPPAGRSAVVELLGTDLAGRLTGHFWRALRHGERIRVDEMERFVPEDLVEARVRAPDGTFKPIAQGSVGQRSTAVLSLLLSAGDQPLIIDQPEDDLDNRYIYDVVVSLLRKRKFSRQIIVATHNANIPVNGDAELIVALGVREGTRLGAVQAQGSIDSADIKGQVSLIMEGSAEAFELRRERYGY